MAGWRWLFALEGMLTGLIGIFSYFYLPPSPTQTASAFRGKDGWFTEREEKIMVNRILRDDPGKGTMHNRQALDFRMFCVLDASAEGYWLQHFPNQLADCKSPSLKRNAELHLLTALR
jgi:hypothetical protein